MAQVVQVPSHSAWVQFEIGPPDTESAAAVSKDGILGIQLLHPRERSGIRPAKRVSLAAWPTRHRD